jgi:hypothetical protein
MVLLGQEEFAGGSDLQSVLLVPMKNDDRALSSQQLVAGDRTNLPGLTGTRERLGRSLCFAVIHNVPLSRTRPPVNENANHSQQ